MKKRFPSFLVLGAIALFTRIPVARASARTHDRDDFKATEFSKNVTSQLLTTDIKVHCRLSAGNQMEPGDDVIVDESMTWVTDGLIAFDTLSDFRIQFQLKNSYLRISVKDKSKRLVIDSNQNISQSLDFETRTSFKTVVSGVTYDTLDLMREEALMRTP
jgi:hypothetical protein